MASQNDLDKSYLSMAFVWSKLSSARRKKVGCLVVKNNTIISDGYNGTPAGFDNDCEFWDNGAWVTKPETLHAESNAIAKLAKSTQSSVNSTMYITCSPCLDCAKLILQSEMSRVVFGELYRDNSGIEFLSNSGLKVSYLNIKNI